MVHCPSLKTARIKFVPLQKVSPGADTMPDTEFRLAQFLVMMIVSASTQLAPAVAVGLHSA